jgi:oligopeptide/dipeptide ABC transporter ATP-binding protein
MYAGQIVERGPTEDVLQNPLHPYTRLLLSAVPNPRTGLRLEGLNARSHHGVVDPVAGCRFVARCPLAIGICSELTPELVEARLGQQARCHVTAPAAEVPHA